MKKLIVSMSLFVAMMMTSCLKEEVIVAGAEDGVDATQAYVSLTISAPSTSTKADGDTSDATVAEKTVTEVALLAFDDSYNYIACYTSGTLTTNTSGNPTYSCAVAADATRFFVVTNYKACTKLETAMYGMSGIGTSANALYEALTLTVDEVNAMAVSGKFVMVNAGGLVNDVDVPLVSLEDGASLSKDSANPTELSIAVDRILAKFNYTVEAGTNFTKPHDDDYVSITGVKLHATNTKSYAYSQISTESLTGGSDYRKDPNMRLTEADAGTELNWLLNTKDENSFYSASTTEYVLENTCDPSLHDYNNLTQAVVKAVFTPSGIDVANGESWFSIKISGVGDMELSFDKLKQYYNGDLSSDTNYGTMTSDSKNALDAQINHILAYSSDATVAAKANISGYKLSDSDVTIALLDAVDFGGYRAASAGEGNCIVKYFQNSINYYDIFIQHDDAQDVGHLGRWGMVRNNSYTLNITGINGHGLPFIPSPFDEDIVDPDNPDPTNPEPADALDAYINAEIVVNEWTTWSQDSVLE